MRLFLSCLFVALTFAGKKKGDPQAKLVEPFFTEQLLLHSDLIDAFGRSCNELHKFCDFMSSEQISRFKGKRLVSIQGPGGAENGFHKWLNEAFLPHVVRFHKLNNVFPDLDKLRSQIVPGNAFFVRVTRSGELFEATEMVVDELIMRIVPIALMLDNLVNSKDLTPRILQESRVFRRTIGLSTSLAPFLVEFRDLKKREENLLARFNAFATTTEEGSQVYSRMLQDAEKIARGGQM